MRAAFISFSHIDNEPSGPKDERWVERFHRDLRSRIRQRIGDGELDLWYDHRISGNEEFSDTIRRSLNDSELFLAIASPAYLNSDWCRRELLEFLDKFDRTGTSVNRRLFRILKEDAIRSLFHDCLQACLGYEFYQLDEKGRARPLWSNSPQYWDRIEDVACDFEQALTALQGGSARPVEGTVYLPDTSWDAAPHRDSLRRELEAKQYAVSLQPTGECLLAIHVVGSEPSPALTLPAGPEPRLVWLAPKVAGPHVAKLQAEAGVGYELLRGPLSELKAVIFHRLEQKVPPKSSQPAVTSGSNIYIVCQAADQQEGRVIRDALKTAHHAILPRFSGEPREIRLEHEEYLKEANAVLVLWPRGDNAGWLRMKVGEVSKAMGLGRTAPFLAKAVLTPHDEDILHAGFVEPVRSVADFLSLLDSAQRAAG